MRRRAYCKAYPVWGRLFQCIRNDYGINKSAESLSEILGTDDEAGCDGRKGWGE